MKKGIYLLYSDINKSEPDGIEKKILAQFRMFESLGYDMSFEILEHKNGTFWNYKSKYADADFIYFRKSTIIDWRFISFFRRVKKSGRAKIFMEIPTYPYEGEYGNSFRAKLSLAIDHYFRKRLVGLIDRIVVTGCNVGEKLWGIRSICIVNGIDIADISARQFIVHGDVINMACVARFSPWHGYERLLKGLSRYYKNGGKRDICVLMVGEGQELPLYKKIAEEENLGEHVRFYGKLTGSRLDDIYNISDIGICSLGRYKSGIDVIGDLKSRDLMSKGLPMLCGCKIDVLVGRDYKYAFFAKNDDSEIDIDGLLNFYDSIVSNETMQQITNSIRSEAYRLIDYRITYAQVLEEIKGMA